MRWNYEKEVRISLGKLPKGNQREKLEAKRCIEME
jgi:hypothetical protein